MVVEMKHQGAGAEEVVDADAVVVVIKRQAAGADEPVALGRAGVLLPEVPVVLPEVPVQVNPRASEAAAENGQEREERGTMATPQQRGVAHLEWLGQEVVREAVPEGPGVRDVCDSGLPA